VPGCAQQRHAHDGGLATVRAALSASLLEQVVSERQTELVRLQLPQFDVKSTVPAKKVLQQLGVNAAFESAAAEFPKLQSSLFQQVYVSDVLHQATVAIDEVGTEASAATAVIFAGRSSEPVEPLTPRIVTVDRPFIFVIRDNPTGSVLFVGQVVAP
jgi:serpin B